MDAERKFKVVFIGSGHAGKTSIIERFATNKFSEDIGPTIGTGFTTKDFEVPNGKITLNIWDTAGQELYKSLIPKYSQGASAIIIVFDSTDVASFESAKRWYSSEKDMHEEDIIWFLVANKKDLHRQQIDIGQASEFATGNNMKFMQTSAKTGENIELLFCSIATELAKSLTNQISYQPNAPEPQEKKSCC
ncbi:putative ras-related protein Rab-5C [Histomonas meleagridis]|uniref:putative ras-related protein Rab-5C n=1 Tax=Histomonas meleagridis TaxID=135588 RepID=UPI00355A269C|nr:putative ras-related protein Rab-5C [Histomonas meleagridis]KAH0804348.1 putative ras-related protein Rab-5C [Histomonas meleagridis]